MSIQDEVRELLAAATPGPWAVKGVNLGPIGDLDNVMWPWVFAVNPMPVPKEHGATSGPLIADLSSRHVDDDSDGLDYAHGGIASIETTDGVYRERDAADATLIARAPELLAELCDKLDQAEERAETAEEKASDLEALMIELAPSDEVEVEGSIFEREELPAILGNYMRSGAEFGREAKNMLVRAEKAEAAIARVRELANVWTTGWLGWADVGRKVIAALDGES